MLKSQMLKKDWRLDCFFAIFGSAEIDTYSLFHQYFTGFCAVILLTKKLKAKL